MHTPTVIVATLAMLSSAVVAQERPKFYFPRQVKRQVLNNTITTSTISGTEVTSTRRDVLGDLLGAVTGGASVESSTTKEVVKTVVISNTVVVADGRTTTLPQGPISTSARSTRSVGSVGSTGGPPTSIVMPSLSLSLTLPTLSETLSPSTTDGIVFGPSGILESTSFLDPTPTETATLDTTEITNGTTNTSGVSYSGTGSAGTGVPTGTDGPIYNTLDPSSIVSSAISDLEPTATDSTTSFEPTTTSATDVSTSTGDVEPTISSTISETGVFPTETASNSTTVYTPPAPTFDTSTIIRNNGTTTGIPIPTTSAKSTGPTTLAPVVPTSTETGAPGETGSSTSDWVGSSILVQPSQTTNSEETTTRKIPSGIPSTLPQQVAPLKGVPKAPVGYKLIQVGFKYSLNYEFVVSNSMSSAQIFTYLPKGIAYGLEIDVNNVIIHSLEPYDTTSSLGYITTLALAYIPEDAVSNLGIMIHVPVSRLYNNPSDSVSTIMSNINPAIPITVGSGIDGSGSPSSANGGGSSTSTPGNGDDNESGDGGLFGQPDQDEPQSAGARGMTAGIATGAVVAAAAYGAAMFFIARRYKRRKLSHRRSRSVMNPAEMMQNGASPALPGGAFMSGARQSTGSGDVSGAGSNDRHSRGSGRTGNSARTAQISGPMMAENSLGWN